MALKVEDVAPNGYAIDRATVRQKKTGRPVKFELTDQTRQAVDDYLKAADKKSGDFLFTGRRGDRQCMTTRHYARLVSEWIANVGLDPKLFGTHSLRRTKATDEDLSSNRKPAGGAASTRPHQDRKHHQIPRYRSG